MAHMLEQLTRQYNHAVDQAERHWGPNGRAQYGGDIMWLMGYLDWAIEAEILRDKIDRLTAGTLVVQ
jgi:hypothetical protein